MKGRLKKMQEVEERETGGGGLGEKGTREGRSEGGRDEARSEGGRVEGGGMKKGL